MANGPEKIIWEDANGVEHELPTKFEVCGRCSGKGTHVNEAIDGNGISREEFDEDPDFAESYFRGDYDVACTACKGLRVVAVIDAKRCNKKLLKAYYAHEDWKAQEAASDRRTMYMESGGSMGSWY